MKLEIRVDKRDVINEIGLIYHQVVIADISAGGEPIYKSPAMMEDDANELCNVLQTLYRG